jgi:hypothetical protein
MQLYNTTQQRSECLLPLSRSVDDGELALFYISLILISTFVLEIFAAFYAFGWRRYTKLLYLFDAIVVLVSFILEVYFHFGNVVKIGRAAAGLVVLRLWKIIRAIHAIAHTMALRNHIIREGVVQANEMVKDEECQAERTIVRQWLEIRDLEDLLEKSSIQFTPQLNKISRRSRAKSLDSITFF